MIKNTILLKEEIRFESFVIPLDCKYEILIKFAPWKIIALENKINPWEAKFISGVSLLKSLTKFLPYEITPNNIEEDIIKVTICPILKVLL